MAKNTPQHLRVAPSSDLKASIAAATEEKLQQLREEAAKMEEEQESKRLMGHALEEKVLQWEKKNGVTKNIRVLLTTLQNVLWENSGWQPVSLSDVLDPNGVKKVHRKAMLLVHPDKVRGGVDQKVIAEKVFDVLNVAFDKFRSTGQ